MREFSRHTNKNWALIEIVIVILFFALSAATVTECFAAAKVISDNAAAKAIGLVEAQNVIEKWSYDPKAPLSKYKEDKLTIYYDNEMNKTEDREDYKYALKATSKSGLTKSGEFADITVTFSDMRGNNLIELYDAKFIPEANQ